MRSFMAKHRAAILAALVINGPQLWAGIKWFLDWAARLDFVASHFGDVPRVTGMIGYLTNPPPWTVFLTSIIGIGIILYDIRKPGAWRSAIAAKNRMGIFIGAAIICLFAAAALGFGAYQIYKTPQPPAPTETELYRRAQADFGHTGGVGQETETIDLTQEIGRKLQVTIWIHSDVISMGRYLVFYIPETIDIPVFPQRDNFPMHPARTTYEAIKQMADRFQAAMKRSDAKGDAGISDVNGENFRSSTETTFNGAIYVYYEGRLSEDERVELRQIYKDHGARVFFRDRRYLTEGLLVPG
jgi:hypothetical protein